MVGLVERLRDGLIERQKRWSGDTHDDLGGSVDYDATDALMDEAADRIAALEAENAALREALGDIAAGRTQGLPASVVAALATNSHRTLEAEYSDWLARQTEGEG